MLRLSAMPDIRTVQAPIDADLYNKANSLRVLHSLSWTEFVESALVAEIARMEAGNGGGEPRQGAKKAAR
jgi:hypothetical protein